MSKDNQFVKVYPALLRSPAFRAVHRESRDALVILCYLMCDLRSTPFTRKKGSVIYQAEMAVTYSQVKGLMSKSSLAKALRVLRKHGIIKVARPRGEAATLLDSGKYQPRKYRLNDKWRDLQPDCRPKAVRSRSTRGRFTRTASDDGKKAESRTRTKMVHDVDGNKRIHVHNVDPAPLQAENAPSPQPGLLLESTIHSSASDQPPKGLLVKELSLHERISVHERRASFGQE